MAARAEASKAFCSALKSGAPCSPVDDDLAVEPGRAEAEGAHRLHQRRHALAPVVAARV
jgi:hypothetical protein